MSQLGSRASYEAHLVEPCGAETSDFFLGMKMEKQYTNEKQMILSSIPNE